LSARRTLRAALALALACATALAGAKDATLVAPERPSGWIDKAPVTARRFLVATANPLATRAGVEILKAGGNAIDAAIAAQLVLGLVEPQSSGLGGGAFLLYHDAKSHELIAYDARETAPLAAQPDRFLDAHGKPLRFGDAVVGGRSVGVPGTVALLDLVDRRHGRLPWPRLFDRAIELAEGGFSISPRLHSEIAAHTRWPQARARDYFLTPGGAAKPVGTVLRNAAYAKTLRALAREGAAAFYSGTIADDIVRTVREADVHPGDLTTEDLRRYRVIVREPVCGAYRRYRVCGMPPPSSGGIGVLQSLAILAPFDVGAMGAASFWSVHFVSEAERLAYADRDVYVADPAFFDVPAGLLDEAYLRERAKLVSPLGSLGIAQPGDPAHARALAGTMTWGEDHSAEFVSTSQVSIVDADGNAVSMTTTIEAGFGSRLMTASGFLLNNELTDFSFVPVEHGKPVGNRVEGGKRPRSTMAPTIAYDDTGRVAIVTGSPGGGAIIDYVVKNLVAIVDWNMDPQAAAALPNFGSMNGPTELEAQTSIVALAPKLRALGHDVRIVPETSGAQTIVRRGDRWIGGADPRREGVVLGE